MISFCAVYQWFHQKITLFLFFYSSVHCNFFVWIYCVPIYACLLVVLFVHLPVFWLYYIGHGLWIYYISTCIFSAGFSVLWAMRTCVMCLYWLRFWTVCILVADFCELCSHVKVVPSMMLLCWIVCPGCSGIRSRIPWPIQLRLFQWIAKA